MWHGCHMSNVINVRGLEKSYGSNKAVAGIDLTIEPGEIFALLGPNGAGKTTVFNVITGVYKPTSGDVLFQGESILGKKRHYFLVQLN